MSPDFCDNVTKKPEVSCGYPWFGLINALNFVAIFIMRIIHESVDVTFITCLPGKSHTGISFALRSNAPQGNATIPSYSGD